MALHEQMALIDRIERQMLVLVDVVERASKEDSDVDHMEYVSALKELKVLSKILTRLHAL